MTITMTCDFFCLLGLIISNACFVNGFILNQGTDKTTDMVVEAEEMEINNGVVTFRSGASNLETVHLYRGSILTFDFCLMNYTGFMVNEVIYSNDGPSDEISVQIDNVKLGEFDTIPYTNKGRGWNFFRSSGRFHSNGVLPEGRHRLIIKVLSADKYGVEIDAIKMSFNTTQTIPSLKCMAFCFDDITYEDYLPFPSNSLAQGMAVQKSTSTLCAEEDNINIPVFHPNVSSFVVAAAMPKYTSFSNSRGPDWHNCEFTQAFWKFTSVRFDVDAARTDKNASMTVIRGLRNTRSSSFKASISVNFALDGEKLGSTDAYIGTFVYLKKIQAVGVQGQITLTFQYRKDKFSNWSKPQLKVITTNVQELYFETPDFAFLESDTNQIRIQVESFQDNFDNIVIGELYMFRRYIKGDVSTTVYEDSTTVIEGVHIDMWWRINETMKVTLTDSDVVYDNIEYLRIYQRVPWADSSYSQIFVMYQDGNVRLLPITPHGLDWIPFGSSVLIGQTDPSEFRPSAPIKHVEINPRDLMMKLTYFDGGKMSVLIKPDLRETILEIKDGVFSRDTQMYPFFTFRSMWVADGNGDVDHVTVEGKEDSAYPIRGNWAPIRGNFFAFYRKCISKHNTLSPDIILKITG